MDLVYRLKEDNLPSIVSLHMYLNKKTEKISRVIAAIICIAGHMVLFSFSSFLVCIFRSFNNCLDFVPILSLVEFPRLGFLEV